MTRSHRNLAVGLIALSGLFLSSVSGTMARGGGAGGFAPGVAHGNGYGGRGVNTGGRGGRFGAVARLGPSRGFGGRITRFGNRNGYFLDDGFGYGSPGWSGYDAPLGVATTGASRAQSLYQRSEIVTRGPSFGEPGYYSRAVIYRIVPAPSLREGTRRFKVERFNP